MGNTLFTIEIQHADGTAEVHEIADEMQVLGRSKSKADILIEDKKISGQHVELCYADGAVQVRDLGSTNGTFFCSARIHDVVMVRPGESFQAGDVNIRLMAVFGGDNHDDAKTMVSMPAWMEDEPSDADVTRALSADEVAAVMAATKEPVVSIDESAPGTVDVSAASPASIMVESSVPDTVDTAPVADDENSRLQPRELASPRSVDSTDWKAVANVYTRKIARGVWNGSLYAWRLVWRGLQWGFQQGRALASSARSRKK